MFTAVVLVCMNNVAISHDTCIVYTSNIMTETSHECIMNIQEGIEAGVFDLINPNTLATLGPRDWYCIDWSQENV